MNVEVSSAYSRRAAEYTELFGSMSAVHPSDSQLVSTWADALEGRVIDAGCGPGQWTNFLSERGLDALGVDLVPEFIERARSEYPRVRFTLGSLNSLDVDTGTVDGVLSWYSLIHHEPRDIRSPLIEFHRVLRPAGMLLIGFFEGTAVEQFDHKVTPAYRWPVGALSDELSAAGFDIIETHMRTTTGQRPHAAIVARRTDAL